MPNQPEGKSQINVDPFVIHVGDTLRGVGVDPGRGFALARDAGEPGHIPGWRLVALGVAEPSAIGALALGVGHMAEGP